MNKYLFFLLFIINILINKGNLLKQSEPLNLENNYTVYHSTDNFDNNEGSNNEKQGKEVSWADSIHEFLIGALFGRFVLVFIGSLVLCVMSKSLMPLFYSLFIICSGIISLHDTGCDKSNLMATFPFFRYNWSFLLFIGHISYFMAIRFFIEPKNIPAKIDKYFFKPIMVFITVINLVTILFFFVNNKLYNNIFPFILLADATLGLLLIFKLFQTEDKGLKLILTGALIMISSGIIRLIMDIFNLFPYFYLYSSGIIAETAFFILAYNHRKSQHELNLALVRNELDYKQREITQKTMYITRQGEILNKLKNQLKEIKGETPQSNKQILNILSEIEIHISQDSWSEFEYYFNLVHPDFFTRLKHKYPNLTSNEVRLCAMLNLTLNTKEIAAICGKTPKSIDVMRNRIRKKMELDRQDRLYDVLSAF